MPRKKRVPKYTHHKPSGQARVIINSKHIYLGEYGSHESQEKYARLLAESVLPASHVAELIGPDGFPDLTINELLVAYLDYAEGYYVDDDRPTKEVDNIMNSVRPLRALYSHSLAKDLGPKSLKAVQQYMIEKEDICRTQINSRINRIRRMFKWAVSEELVPASVIEALKTVPALRYGRTAARETEPVRPVADEVVERTLPFLPPIVADMVRVQRLTSMRPGDLVIMRACDIDRSDDVWIYEPYKHKTKYRGHRRLIPIGPRAKAILVKYLNRSPATYLFSPRETIAWAREQRSKNSTRKTPVYPSELRRRDRQKRARQRRKSKRVVGEHYTTGSYYKAVSDGLEKAHKDGVEIPHWFINQLRHSRATEVRKEFGVEAAQVTLGHAKADVTQVYAERNLDLAKHVARKTG